MKSCEVLFCINCSVGIMWGCLICWKKFAELLICALMGVLIITSGEIFRGTKKRNDHALVFFLRNGWACWYKTRLSHILYLTREGYIFAAVFQNRPYGMHLFTPTNTKSSGQPHHSSWGRRRRRKRSRRRGEGSVANIVYTVHSRLNMAPVIFANVHRHLQHTQCGFFKVDNFDLS